MRRNRRVSYKDTDTKRIFIISFFVLIIAILSFVITYVIYSNLLNSRDLQIAEVKRNNITDLGNVKLQNVAQASVSIGKTINETLNEAAEDKENEDKVNKIAINTSKMIKENEREEEQEELVEKKETKNEEIKVPDPTFIKPVEGEITVNFAKDNLVYSNTLGEWTTHQGIDIKADKTTVVKAAAEGFIKSIKNDPRYGITVVIEHVNGFSTVYANLLTAEFVKEGEKVKQGQSIGTVGNTAVFEIMDDSHLHFEILKDGDSIDPNIYL